MVISLRAQSSPRPWYSLPRSTRNPSLLLPPQDCRIMSDSDSPNGLRFIIVGASIAGLAAAIGLKASGHNVLVLEKESQLGGTNKIRSGCARVPPNGTKILFDWGLEDQMRNWGAIVEGTHHWDPELIRDARGHNMHFRHQDLLQLLYDALAKPSASKPLGSKPQVAVLFGAEVVEVDSEACKVILLSGEAHEGDAIIGADGVHGVVRDTLWKEAGCPRSDIPTGLALYGATVPKSVLADDPDLISFHTGLGATVAMGSNRVALALTIGQTQDISVWILTPDHFEDGSWTDLAIQKLSDIVGPCDIGLHKLAKLAGPASCIQVKDHHELESWVSNSGRVAVLGEAAHPFPPAATHTYSVALEDGAFIGQIFSHTRSRNRVPEFLHAFQEHRQPRCSHIRDNEMELIGSMTMPDGEVEGGRNTIMRANTAACRDVMHNLSVGGRALEEIYYIFGYDPADDADEWWVTWGRFRESAQASTE
ncbi:FAD-binding-3 domain-containing protein [Favolaschia claudopus]|uniref:FAD-binding-3 domain-containing protein n=1 Tax=Favolaschia claudopus TaxID=2862362 RepID=A0AAV9ZZW1_9AGAR